MVDVVVLLEKVDVVEVPVVTLEIVAVVDDVPEMVVFEIVVAVVVDVAVIVVVVVEMVVVTLVVVEFVIDVPVALEVYGSFHEVAMFFDRLAKLDRIVYVQDVELSSPTERGGKVYLKVTGTAVTFRFLSDEEIAAQGAARERRGKGKGRG